MTLFLVGCASDQVVTDQPLRRAEDAEPWWVMMLGQFDLSELPRRISLYRGEPTAYPEVQRSVPPSWRLLMSLSARSRLLGFSALLVTLGFAGSAPAQEAKERTGKQTDEKDKLLILKKTDGDGNLELSWPAPLAKAVFDKLRQELTKSLREAVAVLKKGNKPTAELLKKIQGDYKAMFDKLDEEVDELTITQFLESRSYLVKLKAAIGVLHDPKAPSYFCEK